MFLIVCLVFLLDWIWIYLGELLVDVVVYCSVWVWYVLDYYLLVVWMCVMFVMGMVFVW